MRRLLLLLAGATLPAAPVAARETVTASEPQALSVTVYRDPERSEGEPMNRRWPQGFAMISETRTVTLPPGESTIRFDGVAEGMVAVSAIVTGLPGGTIEKNRNADLLSPAALVNGTLGNRVTITRTNPATGVPASEQAIVRTRADGGLVLETQDGFEAVRCSGLPEKLGFDRVPDGLSADPVFSIDTRDPAGGTYKVVLTYLAWGFDWEANYVATLKEGGVSGNVRLDLMSWLTVLNDNGQSFPDATLLAVAGTINVESDFDELADPPDAQPLRLTCFPLGANYATAANVPPPPPPPPAPMMEADAGSIVVTGSRVRREALEFATPISVIAAEERLGDLKLYRVPETMTVAARGLKQVAFLDKKNVQGEFFYVARCDAGDGFDEIEDVSDMETTELTLFLKNEEGKGLGSSLPMGGLTLFEPGEAGTQLVSELDMRDYAVGQDIELALGNSNMVFSECARIGRDRLDDGGRKWTKMRALLSNANNSAVRVRMVIGWPEDWDVRWPRRQVQVKNGQLVVELTIPANSEKSYDWRIRRAAGR